MNNELGWKIIRTAFKCGHELQTLLQPLKTNCAPGEYREYAVAIAAATDAINVQLIDRVQRARPELRQKIESDLAKFGHIN